MTTVRGKPKRKSKSSRSPFSLLSVFPDYRKHSYAKKVESINVKSIADLREVYLRSGLVLYVGAGVSQSVLFPGWKELIQRLTVTMMTRRVLSAAMVDKQVVNDQYFETIQHIQEDIEEGAERDKPVLAMARALKDELGKDMHYIIARTLYPQRVRFFMHRQNKLSMGKRRKPRRGMPISTLTLPSSSFLDKIVALSRPERDVHGVQAIVNYNYDNLLEEKLREQNVRCITVRSGKDKIPPRALPSYHVHGVLPLRCLNKPSHYSKPGTVGNFVFSEDEYHAEYADPYRWSNMTQVSQLGRSTGLFLGLSMEDPNIRRLIDVTHRQYPETKNYAIVTRKVSLRRSSDSKACVLRNLFEDVEARSFLKIGVQVIWADSHDEVPTMIEKIYNPESA